MSQRTDSAAGLSEQQFAAILGREAAATPGPWAADHTEIYRAPHGQIDIEQWIGETLRIDNEAGSNADAEFIANAREDVPALLAEVERLTARVAELEAAAAAAKDQLSHFIFDSEDPGTAALGAQWLLAQAMPQVDDPFAEPNRYRDEILREAAEKQRTYAAGHITPELDDIVDELAALIDPDMQPADAEGGAR